MCRRRVARAWRANCSASPSTRWPALAPATVTVESDVRVELRGADGSTFQPGEVPPGTYDLIAAWPLNARKALTLELEEGQRAEVRCVADLQRCIQQ